MFYLLGAVLGLTFTLGHKWGRSIGGIAAYAFPVLAAATAVAMMVIGDRIDDRSLNGGGMMLMLSWVVGMTLFELWGRKAA